jgi:acetylornithine deacetylase
MAIVPEPYGTANIITKHTGVMEFLVHVLGRTAHISRMEHGINAIGKAARAVQALESVRFRSTHDPDLPGLPRMCVGSIVGGRGREWELRGPQILPDLVSLFIDVRFNDSMTPATILEDVRGALDAVAKGDPEFRYEVECPPRPERRIAREVMMPLTVPPDSPVVRLLAANVEAVRGSKPAIGAVMPHSYAGNDTAHLFAAGIPCCLYGPAGGWDQEQADRWTSIEQILTCTRVFAGTIADACA